MKKYIVASSREPLLTSANGNFILVKDGGVGVSNTPWDGLKVISEGVAEKHVVEIRLKVAGAPAFNGEPVEYVYRGAEIAHGMRMSSDTLDDTIEYIGVLEEAVDFVPKIIAYMKINGYWA